MDAVVADIDEIRKYNPQRGDMEHLNGITYFDDKGHVIGFKDVRREEFWVAGHIPGRPLLPGVLMIEAAAQLSSFFVRRILGWDGFIGFGGVENCKFRQQVLPGSKLYFICKQDRVRHRRFTSHVQGVVKGQLVFEATITGAAM